MPASAAPLPCTSCPTAMLVADVTVSVFCPIVPVDDVDTVAAPEANCWLVISVFAGIVPTAP